MNTNLHNPVFIEAKKLKSRMGSLKLEVSRLSRQPTTNSKLLPSLLKAFLVFLILLCPAITAFAQLQHEKSKTSLSSSKSQPKSEEVIAVVFGKKIFASQVEPSAKILSRYQSQLNDEELEQWLTLYRRNRMIGLIFGPLMDQYVKDHNIIPTQKELQAFIIRSRSDRKKKIEEWTARLKELNKEIVSPDLDEKKEQAIKQEIAMLEQFIQGLSSMPEGAEAQAAEKKQEQGISTLFVQTWKLNNSLYLRYGGRVAIHQTGPEPVDAYRAFLKEHQKKGSFKIHHPVLKDLFWEHFTNDDLHAFYEDDKGSQLLKNPWWLTP